MEAKIFDLSPEQKNDLNKSLMASVAQDNLDVVSIDEEDENDN